MTAATFVAREGEPTVVVLGLGYVGLPLAVALARSVPTVGLDIDGGRVDELRRGHDRTGEVEADTLAGSALFVTRDPADCPPADYYIVTVPTPVDEGNRPDLSLVEAASRTVGRMLPPGRGAVVVYESTVYPGVTEEICGPILADVSGLERGRDFFLGYSPERINPGDREHAIDRIVKVVAGETPAVTERLATLYDRVTTAGTFRAASIKAAEAAKVIENAQRDINIAFMNEITQIFARLDLSIWDVLAAARTKWNFLPFQPGLVGGHCIGVDPYYLSARAEQLGLEPRVILAGRAINDGMADWVAGALAERLGSQPRDVLVMGLTFKENVPDLRNSKVADLVEALGARGHRVTIHDPLADVEEAKREYGFTVDPGALDRDYDLVVVAVAHGAYCALAADAWERLVRKGGMLADLKQVAPDLPRRPDIVGWTL